MIDGMRKHIHHEGVQEAACGALRNMSARSKCSALKNAHAMLTVTAVRNNRAINQHGGISAVIQVGYVYMFWLGVGLTTCLSCLMQGMKCHLHDADVQESGCALLGNLSLDGMWE